MNKTIDTMNSQNKRTHERISINLPMRVILSGEDGVEEEPSISRDMSSQGAYCFLRRSVPVNLHVELTLADQFQDLCGPQLRKGVLARVVRTEFQKGFGMHGVALRFFNEVDLLGH